MTIRRGVPRFDIMYQIVVQGRLPADWDHWFDQFTAHVADTPDGPVTTLLGPVPDQAALHGTLARIRDLALPVISVRHIATPSASGLTNTPAATPVGT